MFEWQLLGCVLWPPAAEDGKEQTGEPDADDPSRPGRVNSRRTDSTCSWRTCLKRVNYLSFPPVAPRSSLSLCGAYRLNQSSSGSLQTELALAQSPLEVSTSLLLATFCLTLTLLHLLSFLAPLILVTPPAKPICWGLNPNKPVMALIRAGGRRQTNVSQCWKGEDSTLRPSEGRETSG